MWYSLLGPISQFGERGVRMKFVYLGAILFSFAGMLFVDYKYKLAFFYRHKQTLLTLFFGLVVFLVWDAFGIGLGIFFEGASVFVTGLMVAPHLPVEELFFLLFLSYFTLIIYRTVEKICSRT